MRYAVVNLVEGIWIIGLMQNHEVLHKVRTNSYHRIGSIISNWIYNNFVEDDL